MAHFARLVTGMTRIDADFGNTSLEGSAYLSETGDTVVAVMANQSDETLQLTLDLPFYTTTGVLYTTTKTKNFLKTSQNLNEETCRPVVSIAAQSVCTVLFVRSRDRQVSDMKGMVTRFDRLDDMKATKTNFGTAYQLSGKTKTFDHSNPLLSTRTTASYGYVQLDNRYDQLVMQVKKVSSTLNYTSALTTLYYVNGQGKVSTHDYGELDLNRRENFSLIFDLSPATLTDGCRGLISITNNNWSSTLTITFGDVYLSNGGLYAGQLSGAYVADDSYVLDYTSDRACTSLDFTAVTDLPSALPWQESTNRVVYVAENSQVSGTNVVVGTACDQLVLSEEGGNFRPQRKFTAQQASLSVTVDGFRLVMLPFAADIPEGASVYAVNDDLSLVPVQSVPAHTPVLVKAKGTVCFTGSGTVSYANSALTAMLRGTYTYLPLYVGDYTLTQVEGQWGLARLSANATLAPFDVYAQSAAGVDFLPLDLTTTGISSMPVADVEDSATVYNLMGQRVDPSHRGIVIRHGKKYLKR
jgi:glucuronoarabinoxylan endo-1,4-beta-xylanase